MTPSINSMLPRLLGSADRVLEGRLLAGAVGNAADAVRSATLAADESARTLERLAALGDWPPDARRERAPARRIG